MALVHLAISIIVLGFLYRRMIIRETPGQIGKAQAVVPVFLGVISLPISFAFFILNGAIALAAGYSVADNHSLVLSSLFSAFIAAGLPEETAKLLMMLLALRIFRAKIRNVYEYILIGAAVGFGFTLFEEFIYGSGSILSSVIRVSLVTGHMVFGILMARHLGLARYYKSAGNSSFRREYLLAFLIPMLIHTIYDACVVSNKFLYSTDEKMQFIGLIIGVIAVVVLLLLQIIALLQLRKDTEKYCRMTFIETAAD